MGAELIVFKVLKPRKLSSSSFRLTMLNKMRAVGNDIKADYGKTTATWEHDVRFEAVLGLKAPGPELLVTTDDEVYGYVDLGTRPHIIEPKHAQALFFQAGYRAKTQPNVIGSRAGGPFGPVVTAKVVHHPGTKARNFDKILQKAWQPRFKRAMEEAMKYWAEHSEHAIK